MPLLVLPAMVSIKVALPISTLTAQPTLGTSSLQPTVITSIPMVARLQQSSFLLRVSATAAMGRWAMLGSAVTVGRQFHSARAAVAACTSTGAAWTLSTTATVRTGVRHGQSQNRLFHLINLINLQAAFKASRLHTKPALAVEIFWQMGGFLISIISCWDIFLDFWEFPPFNITI